LGKDTNILKISLRGAAIVLENALQGEASPLCHRPRSQVLSITADFDSHNTNRPSEFGQCQYSFGDVAVPGLVGAPVSDLASRNRPVELAKPPVPAEGPSAFLKNRKIQFGAIRCVSDGTVYNQAEADRHAKVLPDCII
jgi:hypothetical protein